MEEWISKHEHITKQKNQLNKFYLKFYVKFFYKKLEENIFIFCKNGINKNLFHNQKHLIDILKVNNDKIVLSGKDL